MSIDHIALIKSRIDNALESLSHPAKDVPNAGIHAVMEHNRILADAAKHAPDLTEHLPPRLPESGRLARMGVSSVMIMDLEMSLKQIRVVLQSL